MPSTVIDTFRHDPQTKVLTVVFQTGRVYRYFNVPAEEAAAMKVSGSKGRYFNAHIRPHYQYEEVRKRA